MKAGIYVRVSTAGQIENTSLDKQVELCMKKAKELGFNSDSIKIYREEGRSGEDLDTRIELTKLREDVANGIISTVICVHPDRLSRDFTDRLIVCREFEKNGAKLVYTDVEYINTPEGEMFFHMMSVVADYELKIIKKRTVRGRNERVRKDKKIMPMRVPPFGYDLDKNGQLVVNEREKEYVQMIYEWYVFDRLTLREIGERLYKLGVKPKRGESLNWNASSIRRILTSEIYIGKYYYNRRATKKIKGELTEGGNPKKTYKFRPKDEWILVEVTPIVDRELWDMAQKQRIMNDKNKHVGNQKYQYLLKSLLKCGNCGRTYQATTYSGRIDKKNGEKTKYRCYRCPNKFPKKYGPEVPKCDTPSIRAELIEEYIWNQVTEIIFQPEKLISRLKSKNEEPIFGVQQRLDALKKDLDKKYIALERAEREMLEADDEKLGRFKKHVEDIERSIKELKEEEEKYQKIIHSHRMNEFTVEQIEQMVKNFREKLKQGDSLSFDVKRKIIEMLFDEIIVSFSYNNGNYEMLITSVGLFDFYSRGKNDVGLSLHPQHNINKVRRQVIVFSELILLERRGNTNAFG